MQIHSTLAVVIFRRLIPLGWDCIGANAKAKISLIFAAFLWKHTTGKSMYHFEAMLLSLQYNSASSLSVWWYRYTIESLYHKSISLSPLKASMLWYYQEVQPSPFMHWLYLWQKLCTHPSCTSAIPQCSYQYQRNFNYSTLVIRHRSTFSRQNCPKWLLVWHAT